MWGEGAARCVRRAAVPSAERKMAVEVDASLVVEPPLPPPSLAAAAGYDGGRGLPPLVHRRRMLAMDVDNATPWPELASDCASPSHRTGHADSLKHSLLKATDASMLEGETPLLSPVSPSPISATVCAEEQPVDQLHFSERALQEESLIRVLPRREFSIDERGIVVLECEEAPPSSYDPDLADFATHQDVVEAWKRCRQYRAEFSVLRAALTDQLNLANLVKNGSGYRDPPPSPTKRFKAKILIGGEDAENLGMADRLHFQYRDLCLDLGLPATTLACHALSVIGKGGRELPEEFSGRALLGNRCAEALFKTLAEALAGRTAGTYGIDDINLNRLDLGSQGLGNEAALALAQLLPHVPKLHELILSRNHISETGGLAIMRQVRVHPGLVCVCLDMNPVPSWIRVKIEDALSKRRESMLNRSSEAKTAP